MEMSTIDNVLPMPLAGRTVFHKGVSVKKEGRWYVLDGLIGSQSERLEIFDSVPEIKGAKRIIDRLRIETQ